MRSDRDPFASLVVTHPKKKHIGKDIMLSFEERPWGKWEEYLNEKGYRVKRFIVKQGKRLSLQKHLHRSETWVIVQGKGLFTLNETSREIASGETITIPVEAIHRVENTGDQDLIVIETQIGDCREEDIVRLQDDWERR